MPTASSGCVDTANRLADLGVAEFHILGTAVGSRTGVAPPDGRPWTTYLAGQRLAKLIEAGYVPVSVAAAVSSVRVWAYCITEYQLGGSSRRSGAARRRCRRSTQVAPARMAARQIAREHVRAQLGDDTLHGAPMIVAGATSVAQGDAGDPVPPPWHPGPPVQGLRPAAGPAPTVRLS